MNWMKIMTCLMMAVAWGTLLACVVVTIFGITGPAVWPVLAVCIPVAGLAASRVYPYMVHPSWH